MILDYTTISYGMLQNRLLEEALLRRGGRLRLGQCS